MTESGDSQRERKKNKKLFLSERLFEMQVSAIIFTYLMTDVQTVVFLVSSKFPVFIW